MVETKSRLGENIAALGTLQIVNYVLVLVTLPFATRALGVESWGRVAFAQVVINYFVWVTNWSFHLGATRQVAICRADSQKLIQIFSCTWLAQWLLALTCSALLLLLALALPVFAQDAPLYFIGLGLILSNVLFPAWFFNGLELMKEAALLQILVKVPLVPAVIVLIESPNDGALYLGLTVASNAVAGFIALGWLRRNGYLKVGYSGATEIFRAIKDGAGLFATTGWTSFYNSAVPIILGLVSGPAAVGLFSLADRARGAVQAAMAPVTQALYPQVSRLSSSDPEQAFKLLYRIGGVVGLFAAMASVLLWIFASPIVIFLGGEAFGGAVNVLKTLAAVPFMTAMSALVGIQILLPFHRRRAFHFIYGVAGIVALCSIWPLALTLAAQGAALTVLITECAVTGGMVGYLMHHIAARSTWLPKDRSSNA